jgi:hypothetical protein
VVLRDVSAIPVEASMRVRRFLVGLLLGYLASLWTVAGGSVAQTPGKQDVPEEPKKLNEVIEGAVKWYDVLPADDATTALTPQPVLRWRNVTRGQEGEAMMVVWPHKGRPVAMASIYPWNGKMIHEFDSLSREAKLIARDKDRVIWSPKSVGVEFKDVPSAPKPAKTLAERLRQMKALAERFKARMTGWRGDDTDQEELRLLPRPLYRYDLKNAKDADPNLLDGALFAYVMGTDPEVVLVLEAIGTAKDAVWQYAFVRATSGGLEVKLGNNVVWTAEKHAPSRNPALPHFGLPRVLEKQARQRRFPSRGETMIRRTLQLPVAICLAIAALWFVSTELAGSPQAPPSDEKKDKTASETEKDADEEIRRDAEKVVREIDLEIYSDDKWTKVERIEKPLLYYGEPTRGHERGSVWGWGRNGRPVALLELWRYRNDRTDWGFTICNTSGGKVRAHRGQDPFWLANVSEAELKDIPGAPAPSTEAAVRQRQLKLLAEKFTGHEFWDPDNTRYELRLLKRPLYTYRDEANGLLEGGLFTIANGTNPEIMFFVEARVDPKNNSKRVWQFTTGRLAHAELHLEYNGKEIFAVPNGDKVSAQDQPYWCSSFRADFLKP